MLRKRVVLVSQVFQHRAYADDVTVIIKSTDDVTKLIYCLNEFQKAASAHINWDKCASLLLEEWEDIGPPQLPQQCKWAQDGFKVLGVFWGDGPKHRK